MKGQLEISERPGGGSVFMVSLPLTSNVADRPHPKTLPLDLPTSFCTDEPCRSGFQPLSFRFSCAETFGKIDTGEPPAVQPVSPSQQSSSLRILVVEDHPEIRSWLQRQLVGHGHTVRLANPADLPISDFIPDAAVIDWNPGEEGRGATVLRDLKDNYRDKCVYGVITADPGQTTRLEILQAGADFLLTKPFTIEQLLEQLAGQNGPGCSDINKDRPITASWKAETIALLIRAHPAADDRLAVARKLHFYANAAAFSEEAEIVAELVTIERALRSGNETNFEENRQRILQVLGSS
jgi:CheY-like chemotaxis protein